MKVYNLYVMYGFRTYIRLKYFILVSCTSNNLYNSIFQTDVRAFLILKFRSSNKDVYVSVLMFDFAFIFFIFCP